MFRAAALAQGRPVGFVRERWPKLTNRILSDRPTSTHQLRNPWAILAQARTRLSFGSRVHPTNPPTELLSHRTATDQMNRATACTDTGDHWKTVS